MLNIKPCFCYHWSLQTLMTRQVFGAKESFLFFDVGIILLFFVKITLKQAKYTYNCNLVCHVFFSLFFSLLSLVHFSVIFLTFVYRICTCYKLLLLCKSRVVSSLLRCQSWLQRMFAYGTIFIFWHNGRILNTISLLNKHLNQCKP